jgi:acyl-CoA thioesterase
LNSEKQTAIMEFDAVPEFCHSEAQIVQGGFITGMMDTCMAHLLIALLDFKFNPVSLDINVSFLAPAHPGTLVAEARILRIGKSIAYLTSTLTQDNHLVATATSTIKLIPSAKKPL